MRKIRRAGSTRVAQRRNAAGLEPGQEASYTYHQAGEDIRWNHYQGEADTH